MTSKKSGDVNKAKSEPSPPRTTLQSNRTIQVEAKVTTVGADPVFRCRGLWPAH